MGATRTMTLLTPDTTFSEGADHTWQIILVTLGTIASRMAGTTIVGLLFLAGMVANPIVAHVQVGIVEVVLGGGIGVTGDDVTFLVDETGLPVVTTNDVTNVILGVPFGRAGE